MPLFGIGIEDFGGLDLTDAVNENAGAIDMLNVDLDVRGRFRARDGFTKFTTSAAAQPYTNLVPFLSPSAGPASQIVGSLRANATVQAVNATTGALLATSGTMLSASVEKLAVIATSGGLSVTYAPANTAGNGILKWTGNAYSNVATTFGLVASSYAHVTPNDSRLMLIAGANSIASLSSPVLTPDQNSLIIFSDVGSPEAYSVNSFVQLTPGDGETIEGVCTFANQVYVFKQSKFFVFTGTTSDAGGHPIFNYRTVATGVGTGVNNTQRGDCCAGPDAVYFTSSTGIYKTTGGAPQKISGAIDPLFGVGGPVPPYFRGLAVGTAGFVNLACYHNRLYFTYTPTAATPRVTLVYDIPTQQWMYWDVGATAMCANPANDALVFAYANLTAPTNTKDLGQFSTSATTDAGTAITARYRSAYLDFDGAGRSFTGQRHGVEKTIRESIVDGMGTVNYRLMKQWVQPAALPTAQSLTLGVSPQVAQARDRRAVRARSFSWQIDGTAPWTIEKLTMNMRTIAYPTLQRTGV